MIQSLLPTCCSSSSKHQITCRCCISKLSPAGVADLFEPESNVMGLMLQFAAVSWGATASPASVALPASDADEPGVFFLVALVLRTATVPVGLVTCTHLSPPSSRPPLSLFVPPPSLLCLRLRGHTGLTAQQALEHYVPILHVCRGREEFFSNLFSFL